MRAIEIAQQRGHTIKVRTSTSSANTYADSIVYWILEKFNLVRGKGYLAPVNFIYFTRSFPTSAELVVKLLLGYQQLR
jgi:hypothetical protein